MTITVTNDDGSSFIIEDVLDYSTWCKDDIANNSSAELTSEEIDKVAKELSNELSGLESFADEEVFKYLLDKIIKEIKGE